MKYIREQKQKTLVVDKENASEGILLEMKHTEIKQDKTQVSLATRQYP